MLIYYVNIRKFNICHYKMLDKFINVQIKKMNHINKSI